eukprot:Colp12_sorted_trinity150504_noHs@22371
MDPEKSKKFSSKLMNVVSYGAILHALSLGERVGLLKVLAQLSPEGPKTSQDIATAAHLNERYVREWLGVMLTGGIVENGQTPDTYILPQEHAAQLVSEDHTKDTMMPFIKMIVELSREAEDSIVECFKKGGGLPYSQYPGFHSLMDSVSETRISQRLLKDLQRVPGLIDRLKAGIDVCDVGCGSGRAIVTMAQAFPNSRFTGLDLCSEAVARATARANEASVKNAHFQVQDATSLKDSTHLHGSFDFIITLDAIHDQAHPDLVLQGIHKMLRAGGAYSMFEPFAETGAHNNMSHPVAPSIFYVSMIHCMPVSLYSGGQGLGAMWGKQMAVDYIKAAGFSHVEALGPLQPGDPQHIISTV